MPMKKKHMDSIHNLIKLVEQLRVKCPWDREQTFDTLRNLTIEETFELSEAIIVNNNGGGQIFNLLPQSKDLVDFYEKNFESGVWTAVCPPASSVLRNRPTPNYVLFQIGNKIPLNPSP